VTPLNIHSFAHGSPPPKPHLTLATYSPEKEKKTRKTKTRKKKKKKNWQQVLEMSFLKKRRRGYLLL
jgi:hypothetical protein